MGLDLRSTNLGDEVSPVILDNTRKRTDLLNKAKGRAAGFVIIACLLLAFLSGNYILNNLPYSTTEATPPELGIGSTQVSEKDGMVMVFVPAGEFTMGSDAYSDEQPIHQVYLDAFWIDQTEITNAMYARCVTDDGCEPPASSKSYTQDNYYGNSDFDNYPVIYIDWNRANKYCAWAGRELPTEAQWEKAARGEDGRTYPWGEGIDCDKANYNYSCIGDTRKAGRYLDGVSPYGVYDMAGNVWEWVSDWYDDNYYAVSPSSNPQGPTSGQYRILRGGSWYGSDYYARSSNRYWFDPTVSNYDGFGFRCAMDADQ